MLELWENTLKSLQDQMAAQHFEAWLRPIRASMDGEVLVLRVPNKFAKDWLTNNYLEMIRDKLRGTGGSDVALRLDLESAAQDDGQAALVATEALATQGAHVEPPRPTPGLNPKYNFQNFVVGPSNQLAHAAALAAAQMPGRKYNPLFIYGGVGLGKTHLVNAIGHALHARDPNQRILYLSAERFTNDFIDCLQNKRMDEFRARYRRQCDVLLMDDIQFIAGRDQTQEEFFHTFNALYDGFRQIVVTSDKYPQEIPDLQERLVSRFLWGLIADIQAPEMETRVAILRKKALAEQIALPDEVAFWLAENIKSNVRELEGTLIRLVAQASTQKRDITMDLARETLRIAAPTHVTSLSVEDIQRVVCTYYNVKIKELTGDRRNRSISFPRQVAMFICRNHLKTSYPELGQKFGGKDHSTVIAACRKIESLLHTDSSLQSAVETIERKLGLAS
ncbi:MAG: chromosomal replication initiator protein DnaA [Deltaproteobacteria bacterium]|nr:chromosomal replication initiator protein DnaA [Deltaproteobacteria bacterium]